MFNIGALLQISALTMGVASATPICNVQNNAPLTEKNETITTPYELTFDVVNNTSQNYIYYDSDNSLSYDQVESKTNYQVQSNYINVLATKYQTEQQVEINDTPCLAYLNEHNAYNLNNKDFDAHATRTTFVIQITPYNYNVDTEITIRMQTKIDTLVDQYNHQTQIESKILNKTIYTTFQDNWSQYLDKTIARQQCSVLINDIENVNNGYYYNKKQTSRPLGNTSPLNPYIEEETILSITPKTTNYIVIDYVIGVYANEYDPFNDTYTEFTSQLVPCATSSYSFNTPKISGTNIIPDGTYEVIDIPGLMWEILTMPFAFVSQAFNLTLFPGTPYQINISNLFLSIIAIVVFVWLISMFLKMKG